jgi:hypothetical protein
MHPVDYNLSFLETALEELEAYLLQSELFWPLSAPPGVSPDFPRLTISSILLTLNELEAVEEELPAAQKSRATALQTKWEALHTKWRTAVETKSIEEMRARLNLWKAYITDLEENKGRQANYDQEVTQRVRFALLRERVGASIAPDELIELMQAIDNRALALTAPAGFVWDEPLQVIYPQDDYLFLYREPKSRD